MARLKKGLPAGAYLSKGKLYVRFRRKQEGREQAKRLCYGADGPENRKRAEQDLVLFKMGRFDPFQAKKIYQKPKTLAELWGKYSQWQKKHSSAKHWRGLRRPIEAFIDAMGPKTDPKSLSKGDVWGFSFQGQRKKELSKNSLRSYGKDVNAFLSWMYANEYIDRPLKVWQPAASPKRAFLPAEDFQKLMEHIDNEHLHTFFSFAFYTGLRLSEQYHLQLGQIKLQSSRPHLAIGYLSAKGEIATKTERPRRIILEGQALEIAEQMIGQGYVWPKERFADKYTYSKVFKAALRQHLPDQENLNYHCLRKSYGYWLLSLGHDLAYVQAMLGHASITTTQQWYVDYRHIW